MKFYHTLQFRLSALLFLIGTLLIAMGHYRHLNRDISQYKEAMKTRAYAMGTRMSGIAQHVYRRRQFSTADLEVSYAAVTPELLLGLICDGQGVVRSTTKQQWRGAVLEETPLAYAAPEVRRAKAAMTGSVEEDHAKGQLLAVFPFNDSRTTDSTGLVLLNFDLNRPLLAARNAALNDTISNAFALLAACVFLWLALQAMITSRLAFVVGQTVAAGSLGQVIRPLMGRDELAGLSRSFANAFQKLKDTEHQFRQFAESMRDALWIAPANKDHAPVLNSSFGNVWKMDTGLLQRKRWAWLKRVVAEDRHKVMHFLAGLRHSENEQEFEFRLAMPDGHTRWLQCRGFRVASSGEDGAAVGGIAVDVTERKDIAKKLVEAAETERRRLGVDLHDDVCQRLAAARLKCGVLETLLKDEHSTHADLAGAIVGEISTATDVVRGFAKGIAPVALNVGDFGPALTLLARQIQRAFRVKCTAKSTVAGALINEQMATHIYRIAQELAVNAAKHGHATWVNLRFSMTPGAHPAAARLEVANDGIAFEDPLSPREGMGLHLVRQRADVIGATVAFHPRQGEGGGTLAICDIPLPMEQLNPDPLTL